MDLNYKGSLQTFCQRHGFALPEYHVTEQSGPDHCVGFKVEVEVNGERFGNGHSSLRLKEGHQSAARMALQVLTHEPTPSIPRTAARTQLSPPPSYVSLYRAHSMKHMPPEHADIEDFILDIISVEGGRIRKIWAADEQGQYKFEITGTYRFCENVGRHHRQNHIYFVVDPVRNFYYQKCHHVECLYYQSRRQPIFSTRSHGSNNRGAAASNTDFSAENAVQQSIS